METSKLLLNAATTYMDAVTCVIISLQRFLIYVFGLFKYSTYFYMFSMYRVGRK